MWWVRQSLTFQWQQKNLFLSHIWDNFYRLLASSVKKLINSHQIFDIFLPLNPVFTRLEGTLSLLGTDMPKKLKILPEKSQLKTPLRPVNTRLLGFCLTVRQHIFLKFFTPHIPAWFYFSQSVAPASHIPSDFSWTGYPALDFFQSGSWNIQWSENLFSSSDCLMPFDQPLPPDGSLASGCWKMF